ncbi:hypothetical protein ACFL4G_09845 [Thermodesulfobacteriota bacterium]
MMKGLEERIERLLDPGDYPGAERGRLVRLMLLLTGLPAPPGLDDVFPRYEEYRRRVLDCAEGDDGEALEESFLMLYTHLHMHEAAYSPAERRRMDEAGGYWAHAGGLSPILKAGPWIRPETVSADLGAGNGLQGLLLQHLDPHRKTTQVEISSRIVEIGRRLQAWLGIPAGDVEWVVGDVCEHPLDGIDFIYLYRPVRPTTVKGRAFYERLAETLDRAAREVVVFSIADCLREFVSPGVEVFYHDGHLTCFRYRP